MSYLNGYKNGMTSALVGAAEATNARGRRCEDRGRDEREVAACQGATNSQRPGEARCGAYEL